jgi:hypothetical protein
MILFNAIAPVVLAFPDLSNLPTPCSKAMAVVDAYSSKTLLIPFLNPLYVPFESTAQPRYKLYSLNLASDPVFSVIVAAVASRCSATFTSEANQCEAAISVIQDVSENGPYWLRAIMGEQRVASLKR